MGITPAEGQIMEVLWRRGPLTFDVINEEVADQKWGVATVRTLVHRLQKRGAIRSERIGGRVQYVPVLERSSYLQAESQSLLDRLFEGRLTPLVAHFAAQKSLTPEEVRHLRKLLEDLDDGE